MRVRDIIKLLEHQDPDAIVIVDVPFGYDVDVPEEADGVDLVTVYCAYNAVGMKTLEYDGDPQQGDTAITAIRLTPSNAHTRAAQALGELYRQQRREAIPFDPTVDDIFGNTNNDP